MDFWATLFEIGAILAVAFAFGAICERFRQSALLGYLLAGMLLGPNALHVVGTSNEVEGLAEVGVSLLLFSLGLEFSLERLRGLGASALVAGTVQVTVTLAAVAGLALALGLTLRPALIVGSAFALSSTAGVLRVLTSRSQIDSVHGRHALGILLFQDLAVIPLVLLAGFLADPGSGAAALSHLGRTGLFLLGMVAGFWVLFNHVVPRVFLATSALRNRELPVLFGVVGALSSIYVAHELGLSPAIGAFIAGMLLGESPFATQIRADLAGLRILLVTVFFTSIGMLADPAWMLANAELIAGVVAAVLVVKTGVVWLALRIARQSSLSSLAAGLCLAQVGEFAFVIAGAARGTLIDTDLFMVIVSTMMVTLFLTPYLIASAPGISAATLGLLARLRLVRPIDLSPPADEESLSGHVVLVGYGPAGRGCAEKLRERGLCVAVIDINPKLVAEANASGCHARVGDATYLDVLEHFHVSAAAAVVVTVPDPQAAASVVALVRSEAERVPVVARSRFHRHLRLLALAGANALVDEEQEVGELLGERTLGLLTGDER